jgi:hypothetical protein
MKALPKGNIANIFDTASVSITESGEQRTSIDFDIHRIMKFGNGLFVACAASSSSVTSNTLTGELESVTIAGTQISGNPASHSRQPAISRTELRILATHTDLA